MANRKGVEAVSKWKCSDGEEFTSARDANDHQGALNETEKFFKGFADWIYDQQSDFKKIMGDLFGQGNRESLERVIFEWEKFKNANASNPALLPESGLESMDDQSGNGKTDQPEETAPDNPADKKPSSAMDEKEPDPIPEKAPAKTKTK